ncbi:MAG: DUF5667 domain-containing protein [Anaerolineales bacterium]|nr:DUF5667 domain-containing protein [Anaerolineales bacterium]
MNTQKKQSNIRLIVVILAAVVILAGAIGVTRAAAQSAIPGDALYPVKTGLEQTRLSLASDAGVRAEMKMEFAEKRLDEIQKLIQEGRYQEVNAAVLAFESEINGAILELGTLAEIDPTRAAAIAKVITSALTRYAQALSALAASAPDSVRSEVARALDTTQVAGGLPLVPPASNSNDNSADGVDDNGNANTNNNDNSNDSGFDDNSNGNGNDSNSNGNDDSTNGNSNTNDNGGEDNANGNGDDGVNDNANVNGNSNGNDDGANDNANSNGADDNDNANSNDNGNSNDDGVNDNGNGADDNNNGNDDSGKDKGNDNSNGDDKP